MCKYLPWKMHNALNTRRTKVNVVFAIFLLLNFVESIKCCMIAKAQFHTVFIVKVLAEMRAGYRIKISS